MKFGGKHYAKDLKERVLKALAKGSGPLEIARKMEISRSTIYRWIDRKESTIGLERNIDPGTGKAPSLTLTQVNRVLKYMENPASDYGFENDLWTSNSVRVLIDKKIGVKVHRTTVYRMLTEQRYSSKKPEFRWSQADKEKQEEWIKKTIPRIKSHQKKKNAILYFCDESAISLTPNSGRTWGPVGKKTILKRTASRGRLNVISAISPSKLLVFSIKKKSIGAKEVKSFLNQILRKHPLRHVIVVLDNASSHHSKAVRKFEQDNDRLKIFYLPTYSPEWNPDEKVWNHLKSIELVAHKAENIASLEDITRKKLLKMSRTPKLLRGIFMRCEISKFFI